MGGEPHENLLHVKPPTRPPAAPAGGGCCSHDTSSTLYTTHRIVPTLHQQQQPHRWPSHAHARAHTSCSCTPPPPAPPPPPYFQPLYYGKDQKVPPIDQVLNSPADCSGFMQPRVYMESQAWFTP